MDKDEPRGDPPPPGPLAQFALGGADPAKANAWLDEQTVLTKLQVEDLRKEDAIRHWSLRVRHISDLMKLAFELAAAFIVLAIAAGLAAALWSAAHDNGLIVEAFSVPPDLAQKGLTGEVIAAKVIDRLTAMQAQTISGRSASSYQNNWGNDIKVQIPDTGVSIGEFNRYLRSWLGHETHISGEVYRTQSGLAITARAGASAPPTYSGPEADLDRLVQQAAESVYRATQPYRYAIYLTNTNRNAEADGILDGLTRTGSKIERSWAGIGVSTERTAQGDYPGAVAALRRAIADNPYLLLAYSDLANDESALQDDEATLAVASAGAALAGRGVDTGMDPGIEAIVGPALASIEAQQLGDFPAAIALNRRVEQSPSPLEARENLALADLQACAQLHDEPCVRSLWNTFEPPANASVKLNRDSSLQAAELSLGHWSSVVADSTALLASLSKMGHVGRFFLLRAEYPVLAPALASTGDRARAHALVDQTPADCVICLRARGQIDAVEKNWGGAAYWFARAVHAAPSVPFAYADWADMFLRKGDYAGAIALAAVAHAKGPHFADPLETWGEALIAQKRSDLALAKFAEAARYAPNWVRLHLEWGRALFFAGNDKAARDQLAIAARLTLTPEEARELQMLKARLR